MVIKTLKKEPDLEPETDQDSLEMLDPDPDPQHCKTRKL
jgi:hypothetical protein